MSEAMTWELPGSPGGGCRRSAPKLYVVSLEMMSAL